MSRYAAKTATPHSSHGRVAIMLDAALRGQPGARILDVGCAGGLLHRAALDLRLPLARSAEWVGIDRDADALADAAAEGMATHHVDLASSDPAAFAGPWAAVVFADVLEHLPDPAGVLARWLPALCGRRTLVYVSLPNVANIAVRLELALGRFEYRDRGILDRDHLRFFTRRSARRLLEQAGLAVQRVHPTPVPVTLLGGGGPALAAAEHGLAMLTRVAPTLLSYQFVFEAHYAHAHA